MFNPQLLQQTGEPVLDVGLGQRPLVVVGLQFQHGAHVVGHIEFAKNRGLLRQIPQTHSRPLMNRQLVNRLVIDRDAPRIGSHQSNDHVKRCGFARTVGPKQTHHFGLADFDGHIVHHRAAAIRLFEVEGPEGVKRIGLVTHGELGRLGVSTARTRLEG